MNKNIKLLMLLFVPFLMGSADFMDYTTLMNQKMETESRLEDHLQGIVNRITGDERSTVLVRVNLSDLSRRRETVEEWLERDEEAQSVLPEREEYLPGIPRRGDLSESEEGEEDKAERSGGKKFQDIITLPSEFIENMRISLIVDSQVGEETIATLESVINDVMDLDPARGDRLSIQTVDFAPRSIDFFGFLSNPYFLLVLIALIIASLFLFGPLKKFLFATLQTMKELKGMKSEAEYSGAAAGGGGGGLGVTPDGELEMEEEEEEEEIEEENQEPEGEEEGEEKEEDEDEEFKKMTYIPLRFLEEKDLKKLAYLSSFEKPQVAALLLKYLPAARAARVLSSIPEDKRTPIMKEIVKFQRTSREVMEKIDEFLSKKIDYIAGGADRLVEMLEMMDESSRAALIEQISREDPEFSEKLNKRIFSFEDIVNMDDASIQTLIQEMETADLGMALKRAPEEVQEKFISNMSEGAAALLKEEIELGKKINEAQIKEKQREIVALIKQMEASGAIAPVTGAAGDELWEEELGEEEKEGVLEGIIEAAQQAYDKKQQFEAQQGSGSGDERSFNHYRKGLDFYKRQDYQNALREFNRSISFNPSLWQSYQYIGSCYLALNDEGKAKRAYQKALELNPSNEQLRQWLEAH